MDLLSDLRFHPKLLDCWKDYNRRKFYADLVAGITVGIVALPLAMAFGIASGVTPQAGIFTAVVAGFIISAFGGSRVQIGGPTGAFIVIVYGIIAHYGLPDLLICTVMAGVILVIMGAARLGTVIKFIPLPVTLGFTNGIAILIFTTQIKDFFGLRLDPVPSGFRGQDGRALRRDADAQPGHARRRSRLAAAHRRVAGGVAQGGCRVPSWRSWPARSS